MRYGWRLADDIVHGSSQYQPALDGTGCPNNPSSCFNIGNYGAIYHIVIPLVASSPKETVQVLLNPRVKGQAFAGTAMIAQQNSVQGPMRLPLGDATVKDSNVAIGLTRVAASTAPLSFEFMAPDGVTLPAAVVLTPSYIRSDAAVTWSGVGATTPVTDTRVTPLTP